MKKLISLLLAIVITVSLFPNIAFAAVSSVEQPPKIKTRLLTQQELYEYSDLAVAGINVSFENFTKRIGAMLLNIMIPKDLMVEVNVNSNKKPVWELQYLSEENIENALHSRYDWEYFLLDTSYSQDYYRLCMMSLADVSQDVASFNLFFCSNSDYTLPASAFELRDIQVVYVDEHSPIPKIDIDNYFVQSSISLNTASATLKIHESTDLYAQVLPYTKNNSITWSSSNPNIATVDANGNVTGKSAGTATITAKSNNGKSASCVVTVQEKNVIDYDDFKYSFDNSYGSFGYALWYKIPKERYIQAGVPNSKIDKHYKVWGGNCYGMSTSSILFYKNILHEEHYNDTIHIPNDFDEPDSWGNNIQQMKLKEMIELFQVSQYEDDLWYSGYPVTYEFFTEGIAYQLNNGNPGVLYLKNRAGDGGHAVVVYGYTETEDGCKFHIYDCSNFVTDLVYKSSSDWHFMNGSEIYSSKKYDWEPTGFEVYDSLDALYWRIYNNNRNNAISLFSNKAKDTYTHIFPQSKNMTITNSAGQVSVIADGEITGEIENARLIPSSYLAEEPTYTIILPTDTYTITGSGDEVVTTAFADDYMSAEVAAKSSTPITVSSDLKSITVANSQESEYSIKYNTYDNLFDEMTLSGIASREIKSELIDSEIKLSGASSLTATATVSESPVYASADTLNDEVTVKCEADNKGATIQILSTNAELTEKAALPERQAVAAPTYDLESGEYTEAQLLTFTKDDETIVYYTTDGSIPSADNGIIYSLPIDINKSMTINAVATRYGYTDSEVITLNYTLPEVDIPVSDINSGDYDEVIVFELTSNNENDEIYYTLDGSSPLESGILYTSPVTICEDTYLLAYTVRNGLISDICEYEYTITPKSPFYISNSLVNQDNEVITASTLQTLSKVKITATKLHNGEQTGTFILAFYDISGSLLYTKSQKSTITEDVGEIEIDIDRDVSKAYTIKAFIWNDTTDINPLSATHTEYIAG